jgi:ribosomal protein S18 acetylase RimI-like enzyme
MIEHGTARRVRTSFEEPGRARSVMQEIVDRAADHLRHYDVVDGACVVGWLAWWAKGDQAEVSDLVLGEPTRAPELLAALVELARSTGARYLGIAAVPGEPARDPLAALDGFVTRATTMVLPLDTEVADPGRVELRAMTELEFDDYIDGSTTTYAAELAAAGMSQRSARAQAAEQLATLLPAGLESPGQSFFTAWVGEAAVGRLWISTERPLAFVYDIEVDESQRRRGYGEAMMNAGAHWVRQRGHPALGLNVFAHNPGARALYDKLGYRVTADFRSLELGAVG